MFVACRCHIAIFCLVTATYACGSGNSASSTTSSGTGSKTTPPNTEALGGSHADSQNATADTSSGAKSVSDPGAAVSGAGAGGAVPNNPQALPPIPDGGDPVAAAPDCYKAAAAACAIEKAIVALTNNLRGAAAKQLGSDPKLAFVARDWSAAQLAVGGISHDGFPDQRAAVYQAEFGGAAPFFVAAENVAMTFGTNVLTADELAQQFYDMWVASPGHKANMVGPYDIIGVGVAISADGRTVMATQIYASR